MSFEINFKENNQEHERSIISEYKYTRYDDDVLLF